jgi:uncharacterized membrane protein
MLKSIYKKFLTGLVTLLPVILTFYLLYWFVVATESLLGGLIRTVISDDFYKPGMGVVIGLLVTLIVGALMQTIIAKFVFARIEKVLSRLPIVKSIYLSIRDLLDYFSSAKDKDFEQVVSVSLGENGLQVVGLVTQADMRNLPNGFNQKDSLLVYIPMSYGIGGFAVLVPRSATKPLNMSMEDAMRFTLTAGVTSASKSNKSA